MLQLSDLRFRYRQGGFELRVPELSVRDGERVAVIGPSGSGKTTLLHLIAGIVEPQAGRVVTSGVDVTALGDAARRDFRVRRVGLVFQEFELLDYLSVLDNVLLPYRINVALRLAATVRARAVALAERLGIGDKLARLPARLSQGERQRAAVCRALVAGAPLLLADEPTGNLDPDNKGRVLDLLCDAAKQSGATLLIVTHDRDLLPRFERVIDVKAFQGGASLERGAEAAP
jgi:putative ABC transport system ATP-binding protein